MLDQLLTRHETDTIHVYAGPGTSYGVLFKVAAGLRGQVLASENTPWLQVRFADGRTGWLQKGLLALEGDGRFPGQATVTPPVLLTAHDTYPLPMRDCKRLHTHEGSGGHWGWDLSASVGEPVYCGPAGGLVVQSVACSKCGDGRGFKQFGIELNDRNALNDPAWNFGYGHYVIVRYLHEQLPESSRRWLTDHHLPDAHLFVMYAHLNSRAATIGQVLDSTTMIGTCGSTGNAGTPHLHLEVRAARGASESNWATMKRNLLDPTVLFGG